MFKLFRLLFRSCGARDKKTTKYRVVFPQHNAVPNQDEVQFATDDLGDLSLDASELEDFALRVFQRAVSVEGAFLNAPDVSFASELDEALAWDSIKKHEEYLTRTAPYHAIDVQPGERISNITRTTMENGELRLTAQYSTKVRAFCCVGIGKRRWTSHWYPGTPLTLTLRLEGLE